MTPDNLADDEAFLEQFARTHNARTSARTPYREGMKIPLSGVLRSLVAALSERGDR
jgi:hypothetical protein